MRVLARGSVALGLLVLVAACMTSQDVITGAWTLVEIDGKTPAAEGALSLLPDGTFTMRPGCNTGGGTYAIDGNRLVTDDIGINFMACEEAVNAQEQALLAVLDGDPRYEIETGTGRLRLTSSAGQVLLFEGP